MFSYYLIRCRTFQTYAVIAPKKDVLATIYKHLSLAYMTLDSQKHGPPADTPRNIKTLHLEAAASMQKTRQYVLTIHAAAYA